MSEERSGKGPLGGRLWVEASQRLGGPRTVPPAVWLRRGFDLGNSVPSVAKLYVAVLGVAELKLNGQAVTEDVFLGSWTDYLSRVLWRCYPVEHLLRRGKNVLGLILGDGWYSGPMATHDRQWYGEQPRVCLRLLADGKELLATEPDWHWRTGSILENDLLMGEVVDARLDPGNWTDPDREETAKDADRDWFPVRCFCFPDTRLEEAELPSVRRQEILSGKPLAEACKGRSRYDFGQNITGRDAADAAARGGTESRWQPLHGKPPLSAGHRPIYSRRRGWGDLRAALHLS